MDVFKKIPEGATLCHFCKYPASFEMEGRTCGGCGEQIYFCLLHMEAYKREPQELKDRIIGGGVQHANDPDEGSGIDIHVLTNVKPDEMPPHVKAAIATVVAGLKMIDQVRREGDFARAQQMLDELREASKGVIGIVGQDIIPKKDEMDVTGMTKQ